ncbi:TetR/AcrR family transcriptional regulator [Streptomyces xanthii]|uniref:TetR/AcrR family transcriptional regulator n=1 Tax=Streptomyces xanthii TaxID=2768069 RepID=A0A7H1BI50_9ACTN|nr:TetR/AcrR family transcriptional regulator [Streptomyces xanthii]
MQDCGSDHPGGDHVARDRRRAILEGAARVIARRGVRGLRMDELATEAKVSTALIYYHFKDRAGTLRHTLEFISERAERYTSVEGDALAPQDAQQKLEQTLLLEFQDAPEVRENSTVWGELRASAIFEPELRVGGAVRLLSVITLRTGGIHR